MPKHVFSLHQRREKVDDELKLAGAAATTRREWQDLQDEFGEHLGWDYADAAQLVLGWRRKRQLVRPVQRQDETGRDFARFTWARSLRHAALADQEPAVQQFRTDVLNDDLLTFEQVGPWVERQRAIDGEATLYARVALPAGWQRGDGLADAVLIQGSESLEVLDFTSGSGWVERVPVARDGILGQLKVLSEVLAKRYIWQPAQATVYLLTGFTPIVQMLRTTETVMSSVGHRITIVADPDVPVELIADRYKRVRGKMLGPRARLPFERGIELVIHAAERPGVATRGLWQQWNRAHPEERYEDLQSFRQALRNAQRRVDGQPRGRR